MRTRRTGAACELARRCHASSVDWPIRFVLCCLLCALAAPAAASPLLELTGDLAGEGGLVARHTGAGPFSAYFNPALLSRAEPQLSLRFLLLHDRIDIDVDPRDDDDSIVPESAAGAFRDDDELSAVFPPPVPTRWLEEGCGEDCQSAVVSDPAAARPRQGQDSSGNVLSYAGLGLVQPIVSDRLVLGLSLLLPLSKVVGGSAFYNDEREQYFGNSLHPELYGDRLTPLSFALGAGGRLFDGLSAGASVTLNLDSRARSQTFVPQATEYEQLSLRNDVSVESSLAPHFGVAYEALERLLLTATLHTEQALEVEAAFSSLLPDGSEQFARRRFVHHFVPLTLALGTDYSVLLDGHELGAVVGVSFERWSRYRDRHGERPAGEFAWSDRLHPSLQLRHVVGDFRSALDATFLKSPAPEQAGRGNHVDNDRLGLGLSLRQGFCLAGIRLRAGLSLQAQRLLPRSHHKRVPDADADAGDLVVDEVPDDAVDRRELEPVEPREGLQTNNPGFPGFASEGWLLSGGVNLELLLQ